MGKLWGQPLFAGKNPPSWCSDVGWPKCPTPSVLAYLDAITMLPPEHEEGAPYCAFVNLHTSYTYPPTLGVHCIRNIKGWKLLCFGLAFTHLPKLAKSRFSTSCFRTRYWIPMFGRGLEALVTVILCWLVFFYDMWSWALTLAFL